MRRDCESMKEEASVSLVVEQSLRQPEEVQRKQQSRRQIKSLAAGRQASNQEGESQCGNRDVSMIKD